MQRVEKPWGYELIFAETEFYVGKILHVEKDEQLSLQYHEVKDETVYVATGVLELELQEGETGPPQQPGVIEGLGQADRPFGGRDRLVESPRGQGQHR